MHVLSKIELESNLIIKLSYSAEIDLESSFIAAEKLPSGAVIRVLSKIELEISLIISTFAA